MTPPPQSRFTTGSARLAAGVAAAARCGAVLAALSACAHRIEPAAPAAAPADARAEALAQAAERVVLDSAAFAAAAQRGPATPSAAAGAPPAVAPVPPPAAPARLSVYFGPGSARLAAEQAGALQAFVGQAPGRGTGLRWQVTAHTDPTGSPQANRRLGRARAEQVVEQLVRSGAARQSIHADTVPSEPAAGGRDAPQTLPQARRVDIERSGGSSRPAPGAPTAGPTALRESS